MSKIIVSYFDVNDEVITVEGKDETARNFRLTSDFVNIPVGDEYYQIIPIGRVVDVIVSKDLLN